MYKKIRDGLFDPKKIITFVNDKAIDTIIFVLFFAILLTAPSVFYAINYDISFDTKSEIISIFKGEDIGFEINNGELVQTGEETGYIKENENYALIIGEGNTKYPYATIIRFNNDSITIGMAEYQFKILDYLDYEESANLELFNLTNGRNETWDQVFKLVNNYMDDRPGLFIVLPIIIQFLMNIASMLMVALIISVGSLLRLRGVIKFGEIFKLNIYCLIPFIVGTLIDSLFGMSLIYIIGVIITFVYSYITQIEVLKKVYSHHTEG